MNASRYLETLKERDNAIKSLNPTIVKQYCKKYNIPIPPEERFFMGGIYKAAYHLETDRTKKEQIKDWLLENGFTTDYATPFFKLKEVQ